MSIMSFKMGSEAPLDPKSGGAGQKQHHLVVLTKEIDLASPKFQTAFTSAEQFNKIEIQLDKKNPNSKKPQPTKVTLTNATIAQIQGRCRPRGDLLFLPGHQYPKHRWFHQYHRRLECKCPVGPGRNIYSRRPFFRGVEALLRKRLCKRRYGCRMMRGDCDRIRNVRQIICIV
jgi:hypothetical protein